VVVETGTVVVGTGTVVVETGTVMVGTAGTTVVELATTRPWSTVVDGGATSVAPPQAAATVKMATDAAQRTTCW
tara:strand:+ start:2270 stop:2491 length:222 start_codon:yes stop_codon:yes gene_type:complete